METSRPCPPRRASAKNKLRALAKGLHGRGRELRRNGGVAARCGARREGAQGAGGTYTSLVKEAADAAKAAEEAAAKTGAVPSELAARVLEANAAVDEFAGNAKSKLSGVVAKQMMGIDAQSDRLKKSIGEIFGGLNIDPVLNGMQTLVGLFDRNSAAGRTMKFLFESIFQPLINQAEKAAYVVEAFALGFLIGLTKVYIEIKPLIKTISDLFGFEDTSLTDTLSMVTIAAKSAAYVFTGFAGDPRLDHRARCSSPVWRSRRR